MFNCTSATNATISDAKRTEPPLTRKLNKINNSTKTHLSSWVVVLVLNQLTIMPWKTYEKIRIYLQHFSLGIMEISGKFFSPAAVLHGKKPLVLIVLSGRCGWEKNILLLPGIEPRQSIQQPVAIPPARPSLINLSVTFCFLFSLTIRRFLGRFPIKIVILHPVCLSKLHVQLIIIS
jgi:hypothetical protein